MGLLQKKKKKILHDWKWWTFVSPSILKTARIIGPLVHLWPFYGIVFEINGMYLILQVQKTYLLIYFLSKC